MAIAKVSTGSATMQECWKAYLDVENRTNGEEWEKACADVQARSAVAIESCIVA